MIPTSPIPLYHLISTSIQRRIEDGEYGVGEAMPTEAELAEEFDVSRPTIRQALAELVQAGMITRRRGSGTYVLPGVQHRIGQRFRGSLGDLIAETKRAGVQDISVDRNGAIPPRIAKLLEMDDAVGTIVKRTRTMDERAFAFTVNYLPEVYGRLLTTEELKAQSLMALLESKGVAFTMARQSVRAQMASPDLTESLGLPYSGAPVLFVERLVFGVDDRPVELVHTWYRGDAYEYTATFELSQPSDDESMGQLA
jgi:GntR family transcriptional regulator